MASSRLLICQPRPEALAFVSHWLTILPNFSMDSPAANPKGGFCRAELHCKCNIMHESFVRDVASTQDDDKANVAYLAF